MRKATLGLLHESCQKIPHGCAATQQGHDQPRREKHLPPSDLMGLRLAGCHHPPNSGSYDRITGKMVWKKPLQIHGSAGPSGLDTRWWRSLLSQTNFVSAAADLRNTTPALARKLVSPVAIMRTPCLHAAFVLRRRGRDADLQGLEKSWSASCKAVLLDV